MPMLTVLSYILSSIGIAMIGLSLVGWCILIVEYVQDKIAEWKRK